MTVSKWENELFSPIDFHPMRRKVLASMPTDLLNQAARFTKLYTSGRARPISDSCKQIASWRNGSVWHCLHVSKARSSHQRRARLCEADPGLDRIERIILELMGHKEGSGVLELTVIPPLPPNG